MLTFAKNLLLVRIVQQNDWVVFILVGCVLLYIFMLLYLQRDSSVKVFLMQKFADSSNNFLSWTIISLVHCLLLATLLSQSIPLVPKAITEIHLFGYELNKFGFTLAMIIAFYGIKNMLSYIFYAGTGSIKKWSLFQFTASKIYFTLSFLLIVLCVYQYFYEVYIIQLFDYYAIGFGIVFLFKILLYSLSRNKILPQKWYYKILYICTLQIIPIILLWRVLYF